ncbi:zinc ribbon domain-containing protein [Paenibacillus sp. EC2-1]|uniref:zinc ribbon domain-containing protein n=1 Tax=Paenibacillus sp. EC2-1 TaxID=3388665 RepID=UPI003BEEF09F
MSFFNKMKSGMNQVKDKAAQTVETTRISSQISSKREERNLHLKKLGEIVHLANQRGNLQDALEQIQQGSYAITQVEHEIESLEMQMLLVKGEKRCSCGAVIPANSRFCNSCGSEVKVEELAPVPALDTTQQQVNAFCTSCGSQLESDSAFCTSCGAKIE